VLTIFKCVIARLKQESLLRVHAFCFGGLYREERCVKPGWIIRNKMSPTGHDLHLWLASVSETSTDPYSAWSVIIRLVKAIHVPTITRHIGHCRSSLQEKLP
jgi:hypothetical protein